MKLKLTLILLSICIFESNSQTPIDSVFQNEAVWLYFTLARTEHWEPYKNEYENILEFRNINDSTTIISYFAREYIDSEIVTHWRRKVDNHKLESFIQGLQELINKPKIPIEAYAYVDVDYPLDYILIKADNQKINFYSFDKTGRELMDLLLD